MKKFIVAWASLFDNELKIEVQEAQDELQAWLRSSYFHGWEEKDKEAWLACFKNKELETLRQESFDCDILLNIQELV